MHTHAFASISKSNLSGCFFIFYFAAVTSSCDGKMRLRRTTLINGAHDTINAQNKTRIRRTHIPPERVLRSAARFPNEQLPWQLVGMGRSEVHTGFLGVREAFAALRAFQRLFLHT